MQILPVLLETFVHCGLKIFCSWTTCHNNNENVLMARFCAGEDFCRQHCLDGNSKLAYKNLVTFQSLEICLRQAFRSITLLSSGRSTGIVMHCYLTTK